MRYFDYKKITVNVKQGNKIQILKIQCLNVILSLPWVDPRDESTTIVVMTNHSVTGVGYFDSLRLSAKRGVSEQRLRTYLFIKQKIP